MRTDPRGTDDSHKNLWAAVIEQSTQDIATPTKALHKRAMSGSEEAAERLCEVRELIRETARWFASHSKEVGAFLWICDRLDLDPSAVRQRALYGWAKAGHGKWRTQEWWREQAA